MLNEYGIKSNEKEKLKGIYLWVMRKDKWKLIAIAIVLIKTKRKILKERDGKRKFRGWGWQAMAWQ